MPAITIGDSEPLPDPRTEEYKLRSALEALNEANAIDWIKLAEEHMSCGLRKEIRMQINERIRDLSSILHKLDDVDANST